MRLIALAAASLLHSAPPSITTQVYGQGEWRLTVTSDAFTKEVRCRLENHNGVHPDVVAVPGGLAFRLGGSGLDTFDAWYRLDEQPARPWRDLRAELVAKGSLAEAERLDNPSGGDVFISLSKLKGIKTVTLRRTAKDRPRSFDLTQATALVNTEIRIGCNI